MNLLPEFVAALSRPRFLRIFLIMGMASCTNTDAVEKENGFQNYDGSRGFWLNTPAIEAFVAVEPQFRILAVQRPGHSTLLADRTIKEQGLRLAFMEPEQIPASFDVGNQPARILERTPHSARLQLTAAGGLRYTVGIALESGFSRLKLDYELENASEQTRNIACWSLMSFASGGNILVPFEENQARRRLVFPVWATWPQPEASFGDNELIMGASRPAAGDACKIGVITRSGWIAFIRNDEVIVSSSPFIPGATYPEDGPNVSLFKSGPSGQGRCETEQMSPLMEVHPGKSAKFQETLDLFTAQYPMPEKAAELRKSIDRELQARLKSPAQ